MNKYIFLVTFCVLLVTSTVTTSAEAPVLQEPYKEVKTTWTVSEVKDLVSFYEKKWNVSSMHKVVACESTYNYRAVNWSDSHKLSKGSHGVGQFSKETFAQYAMQMGKDYDDPYNPEQALDVMGYMFSKGLQRHWSCFSK